MKLAYRIRLLLIFLPFSLSAITTLILYSPPSLENNSDMTALIITTIIGFLTMIIQQLFAYKKSNDEHNWTLEHRKHTEEQTKIREKENRDFLNQKAQELRLQTENSAEYVAQQTTINTEELRQALSEQVESKGEAMNKKAEGHVEALAHLIEKTTQVSTQSATAASEAFSEANATNRKIQDLQQMNKELLERMKANEQALRMIRDSHK